MLNMGNSPQDTFSDFVVVHALGSMDNQTKVALSRGMRTGKGKIAMEKRNVQRALDIFLGKNPGFEGQIEITPALQKAITSRLTDAVLNEGSILGTATAVGRKDALFTSGDVLDYA